MHFLRLCKHLRFIETAGNAVYSYTVRNASNRNQTVCRQRHIIHGRVYFWRFSLTFTDYYCLSRWRTVLRAFLARSRRRQFVKRACVIPGRAYPLMDENRIEFFSLFLFARLTRVLNGPIKKCWIFFSWNSARVQYPDFRVFTMKPYLTGYANEPLVRHSPT